MRDGKDTRRPDDEKLQDVRQHETAAHREARWLQQHGAEDASQQQPSEKSGAETDVAAGESPS
jgi:hypothetical protein